MQTIYLDVLVALNLYITWAMLYCTGLLTHRKAGRLRMGLGALAGGLSALILLLPQLPGVLLGLLRLGLAGGIILIAFGWQGWRTFLRLTLIFFLVSLLFVGGMIGLYALGSPSGMAVRNGTVYFHVSALTLVLATLAGCLISKLLSVLLEHQMPERMTEAFRCTIRDRELLLQLYIDTGNRLTSFGKPVAVVSAAVLSGILPPEVIACAADITLAAALPEKLRGRLRLVSCRTAAGQKLLPALPAVLYRLRDGASFDCLVALTEEKCFGETDGVIGLLE